MQKNNIFAIIVAMALVFSCLMVPVGAHRQTQASVCVSPVASFIAANQDHGVPPLNVFFQSTSTGNPTSYTWSYQKRDVLPSDRFWVVFSHEKNPRTKFARGEYDIKLVVKNSCGTNTSIRSNYIKTDFLPCTSFTATPRTGVSPLVVTLKSTSVVPQTPGEIVHYMWKIKRSNETTWKIIGEATQNTHTFTTGTYDVNLMVTNDGGTTNRFRYGYIVVT